MRAVAADGAAVALWADWAAAGLPKRDDMAVPGFPVLDGKNLPERHFGFERRLCVDEREAVAYAVDVHVDAYRRQVEAE